MYLSQAKLVVSKTREIFNRHTFPFAPQTHYFAAEFCFLLSIAVNRTAYV